MTLGVNPRARAPVLAMPCATESGSLMTSIARARVDLIAGGCAVHELYEQTDGLIGDSILSFDPVRKVWQQTWVNNGGGLMVLRYTGPIPENPPVPGGR